MTRTLYTVLKGRLAVDGLSWSSSPISNRIVTVTHDVVCFDDPSLRPYVTVCLRSARSRSIGVVLLAWNADVDKLSLDVERDMLDGTTRIVIRAPSMLTTTCARSAPNSGRMSVVCRMLRCLDRLPVSTGVTWAMGNCAGSVLRASDDGNLHSQRAPSRRRICPVRGAVVRGCSSQSTDARRCTAATG